MHTFNLGVNLQRILEVVKLSEGWYDTKIRGE